MSIKGQVLQRYYGWYASRTCGIRRRAGTEGQQTVYAAPVPVPLREARRRWAELLRRIFEVAAGMSPLRANHAHRGLHHRARSDRPHPRSLTSYRCCEVPFARTASSCPKASRCGRFHLDLDRCTPRPRLLARGCLGCPATPMTDPQPGTAERSCRS